MTTPFQIRNAIEAKDLDGLDRMLSTGTTALECLREYDKMTTLPDDVRLAVLFWLCGRGVESYKFDWADIRLMCRAASEKRREKAEQVEERYKDNFALRSATVDRPSALEDWLRSGLIFPSEDPIYDRPPNDGFESDDELPGLVGVENPSPPPVRSPPEDDHIGEMPAEL